MIRIVTDSTCDLPAFILQKYNIIVVPAFINVGTTSYQDGIDITRTQFYHDLPHYPHHPTTAAPAVGTFTQVYEQLASEGATDIISMHVASSLSGILNSARLGAKATDKVQVHLFDSKQLTMGLGLQVWVAGEGVNAGKTIPQLFTHLEKIRARTHVYAGLSTLKFLRRSGRVNWAQFGLGTLLRVKPVLHVHDGALTLQRIRTKKRAYRYLLDQLQQNAPYTHLAILHTANRSAADTLKVEAMAHLSETGNIHIVEVTPAIGTHVGPGGLGLAFIMDN